MEDASPTDDTPLQESFFKDKVIAINGGDGPMYKETADILRSQGARISWASNLTMNAHGIRGINQCGRNERTLIWYVDVRKEEHIQIWIEETIELWGTIYGFVNLGWGSRLNVVGTSVQNLDIDEMRFRIDTALIGTAVLLKTELAHVVPGGSIVNVSSVWGQHGLAKHAELCAAEAGIQALTRCAARECAEQGVRVNAIAVGFVQNNTASFIETAPAMAAALMKKVPLQRFGDNAEVGNLVEFLLSDKSAYMTGNIVNIDGGIKG
ncbi:hypothetical protein FB567DRAFT_597692 [Paraphoma chrysanthemicola]|uniref:Uncharacterized protein n=1 Tax=Paraphoma chrysanthemicola TaxID=798071 RepID=A0A8K0VTD1_9PLEO|nr:hypothetical protein FB567DRAFT_597692 [Paraphoma chrysanthemicola]